MIRSREERVREVRERMRGGEGSVIIEHLFRKEEFGGKVRLCANLVIPPGAGIGPHAHEGEDEVYVVTRGAGLLDEGKDAPVRVRAGDAILTGKGGSHAIRNDGSEPLEILAMIVSYA